MRFVICISNFGKFRRGRQYSTPHCNLGPGVRQFSYQIFTRTDYNFLDTISDREFRNNFIYLGEFKMELDWCDELFNILMDGQGDMYNLVC